jgi:hypothetical protein
MFVSQSQTPLLVSFCPQLFLLRQRHFNESQTIRRMVEVKRAVFEPDTTGAGLLKEAAVVYWIREGRIWKLAAFQGTDERTAAIRPASLV